MLITRTPLRISLGGGATDLPSFYRRFGGEVVAAAINKYIFVAVNQPFRDKIIARYSSTEIVDCVADLKHPVIREALKLTGLVDEPIEIASFADVPAGTGMGSSGCFTVGLLHALHKYKRHVVSPDQLAEEACHIEMDLLGEPVGKQDQFIAAYGGVTAFRFDSDDTVAVESVAVDRFALDAFEDDLLLFFTGSDRKAGDVLGDQDKKSRADDAGMLDNLRMTKELGVRARSAISAADWNAYASIVNEHWAWKRQRSPEISNCTIDELLQFGIDNGARAAKLVGAGGGGFLLFLASDRTRLRRAMAERGLRELPFRFDHIGSCVVADMS